MLLLLMLMFQGPITGAKQLGYPFFNVYVNQIFDKKEMKNLDEIDIQIIYDDLIFTRNDEQEFVARFEIHSQIFNTEDELIDNFIIKEKLIVNEYSQTNSKNLVFSKKKIVNLNEGKYQIKIAVTDIQSGRKFYQNQTINVENKENKKLIISEVQFFDVKSDLENAELNSSKIFNDRDGKINTKFKINILDFNLSDSLYLSMSFYRRVNMLLGKTDPKNISTDDEKVFEKKYLLQSRDESTEIDLLFDKSLFSSNYYLLSIKISDKTKTYDEMQVNFSFQWTKYPSSKAEMSLAFDQMKYILDSDSLNYYQEKDLKSAQGYFKRFWQSIAPNKTEEDADQLMHEFFRRVQFSVMVFSNFKQNGWTTDRGRIYIKFGPPDEVNKYPFQANTKPYEVWYYYKDKKTFVFVDYTGFNDYRLHENYRQFEFQ